MKRIVSSSSKPGFPLRASYKELVILSIVTDLITAVLQLLRGELDELVVTTRDAMEPMEP